MIEICSLFGVRAVSCASVSVLAVVDVVVSVSLEIFVLNYLCEAAVCIHRLTPYLFLRRFKSKKCELAVGFKRHHTNSRICYNKLSASIRRHRKETRSLTAK